ncbi:11829_t:CDS:2 [Funneliformis caledonium]|uniref:11829_t:CDS:1 n=1 Tax=Funneliformis caledonium TaxID=1117310 RepID=A0A9N9NCH0_9GLOM|nr:11829_t:CDS:2 [Funneliformis caledonium]
MKKALNLALDLGYKNELISIISFIDYKKDGIVNVNEEMHQSSSSRIPLSVIEPSNIERTNNVEECNNIGRNKDFNNIKRYVVDENSSK